MTDRQTKPLIKRTKKQGTGLRRDRDLKVPVLPPEEAAIKENARRAKLPVARYLREVGQGYVLKSLVDYEAVRELARVNADLERLGRLLKLWLTKHPGTAHFNQDTIEALLKRIEAQQEALGEVMRALVRPRTER